MRWTILGFAMLLVTVGCSPSTSNPNPSTTFTGTYSGTSNDSNGGDGVFVMGINQSGSYVNGHWGDAYAKTHLVSVGTFTGRVSGGVMTVTAQSEIKGECPLLITARRAGASLSGSYTGIGKGCTLETGTFAMPYVKAPPKIDSRPFTGTVSDDRFGDGAARLALGNIVPPFFGGDWSFDYAHPQKGHVSGFITSNNLIHAMFMVRKRAGELAECEMAVVGARWVHNTSIDGAYDSVELLPCLFKDRHGKFDTKRH